MGVAVGSGDGIFVGVHVGTGVLVASGVGVISASSVGVTYTIPVGSVMLLLVLVHPARAVELAVIVRTPSNPQKNVL